MEGYAVRNDGVYGCRSVAKPEECAENETYSTVFVPYEPTSEDFFTTLRAERDARLASTDKYLLADYPITADALELVKAYRAALRDLPDQPGAPWDGGGELTPWPDMPAVE